MVGISVSNIAVWLMMYCTMTFKFVPGMCSSVLCHKPCLHTVLMSFPTNIVFCFALPPALPLPATCLYLPALPPPTTTCHCLPATCTACLFCTCHYHLVWFLPAPPHTTSWDVGWVLDFPPCHHLLPHYHLGSGLDYTTLQQRDSIAVAWLDSMLAAPVLCGSLCCAVLPSWTTWVGSPALPYHSTHSLPTTGFSVLFALVLLLPVTD